MVDVRNIEFPAMLKWKAISIVILALLSIWILNPFYTVDAGERAVVTWFGEISGTENPGFHIKVPIANGINIYNVRTQTLDADAASASSDLQTVHTKISVIYHLEPNSVAKIYSELGYTYESIIEKKLQDVVKAATAKFTAEGLITHREHVALSIQDNLSRELASYHIVVEGTPIQNFDFSKEFNDAIEAKNVAMQDKLRAQQRYEQTIIDQKAELAKKETEAKALERQKSALMQSPELIELRKVEAYNNWIAKWDGQAMPQIIMGDAGGILPMMDITSIVDKN